MAKKKENKQTIVGLSASAEDLKLLQELRERYEPTMGALGNAQLLRMGLRSLAEAAGLR